MDELKWKVVYCASRQEKKLAERLQKAGIIHYLPLFKKLSQWSDRKKWVEWPLFSGYVFVKPNALQRDQVLQESGAIAYLRFNGQDAVVTDKEVEIIKSILNSGYSMEAIHTPEDFKPGDKAVVMEGPLKGHEVDIHRRNDAEEFLVSFDTLGQSIKINLPFQVLKLITN